MKPRVIALLAAVLLLIAVGAYVLTDYNTDKHAAQVMAQLDQTQQGMTAASLTAGSSQSVSGTTPAGAAAVAPTPQLTPAQTPAPAAEQPAEEPSLRFIAVGDIMLGRGVGMRLQKYGSYDRAFDHVSSVLKQGDVVFANLESPITNSTHSLDPKRKIVLKARPEAVSALTGAGFNLISIANNHMMDYYETGLFDTMSILNENHILFAGSGKNIDEARKPAIIEKNGLKIGLLAYSDMAELVFAGDPYLRYSADKDRSGISPRKYETVIEDVRKLRDQVDLLAVSLHWGVEDSFTVSDEQREFAHNLIDNGVDVILGHHPHQFQGIEMYKGKPIFYSMGNFLFDQNESENMESFIIDMKYKGTELTDLTAIPVRILDKSYVEIQTGKNAANIITRQTELCRELGTPPEVVNDRLVFK